MRPKHILSPKTNLDEVQHYTNLKNYDW